MGQSAQVPQIGQVRTIASVWINVKKPATQEKPIFQLFAANPMKHPTIAVNKKTRTRKKIKYLFRISMRTANALLIFKFPSQTVPSRISLHFKAKLGVCESVLGRRKAAENSSLWCWPATKVSTAMPSSIVSFES